MCVAEDSETSFTSRDIVPQGSGSHLIVCELSPGMASMMHRTVSLDYVTVTNGQVIL
jgi:hypothetical protein